MEAYLNMGGDRLLGMGGIRPTPFLVYDRYAERHGLAGEEYEEFEYLIHELDREHIDFHVEKAERERVRSGGRPRH